MAPKEDSSKDPFSKDVRFAQNLHLRASIIRRKCSPARRIVLFVTKLNISVPLRRDLFSTVTKTSMLISMVSALLLPSRTKPAWRHISLSAVVLGFILTLATSAQAQIAAMRGEVVILRNPAVDRSTASRKLSAMDLTMHFTASPRAERILVDRLQAQPGIAKAEESGEWLSNAELSQLEDTCKQLKGAGIATHCSPNYRYEIAAIPNDPSVSQQYHTALMHVPEAWDITTGSSSVVVTVIDTGVMLNHPDLAANIWTNPGEIADGLDNDGNGLIDDLHGYDWVNSDSNPTDDQGHGTLVSGIIAAVGNNGIGGVGVNQQAKIQALKVFSNQGTGFTSDVLAAIDYAVNSGTDVINMSFGGFPYSEVFEAAIANAGNHGALVVAGAGNNSSNNDITPFYPANYNTTNIISVAASDQADQLTNFSNYGAQKVHLAAPGIGIFTTVYDGGYGWAWGTSMSTPQVAGAAALVKAANSSLGPTDIKAVILENIDRIDNLNGVVITGGRLNVYAAVSAALNRTPVPPPTPTPAPVPPADPTPVGYLRLTAARVRGKSYALSLLALDSADVLSAARVANASVSVRCRETSGRKRRYQRNGTTAVDGIYRATLTIRTAKARCSAQAANGVFSSAVTLRKR